MQYTLVTVGGGAGESRATRAGKLAGGGTGGSPKRQEVEERVKKGIFVGPMLRLIYASSI
jgi:hypothetical protein